MLKLYKWPNLEYASIVWNPHLKCNIEDLEKVQKFAIKVCLKQWDYSISYLDILKQAELGQSLYHLFKFLYNIRHLPYDTLKNFLPKNHWTMEQMILQ